MKYVRVTKIAKVENARFPTALADEWISGQDNDGKSPPIEYWIEGYLLEPLKVGNALAVDRRTRNGIEASGLFRTSRIVGIKNGLVSTENSQYLVEFLNATEN